MLSHEFVQLNEAVELAGSVLMGYFGKQLQRTYKSSSADYRTKADVESEKIIIDAIETIFPDYSIFAEEHGKTEKNSRYTFVIDPLDGTNNFVLGIPAFTSSVALMRDGEMIYGVIHAPVTGDTYHALKGAGAFLNGAPISVNDEHQEKNITVSYCCNYTSPKDRTLGFKTKLLEITIMRSLDLWSPAFCYCALASGRIEAIINDGIELYDFAAGKLIAREAGAKVTDFQGEDILEDAADTFLATNGTAIHPFLVENITREGLKLGI